MNNLKEMSLLRNIVRSQERRRYYSTSTNKINNTYKCSEHNDYFTKICLKCNNDICPRCEKIYHYNHNVLNYEDINPDNSEIDNLQRRINTYMDIIKNLKKEINNWYNDLKIKLYDFELSLKNNDIINSFDFIINYSKQKICLDSIFKFRKIYNNIMEENNMKNKKIISIINQYGNMNNINIPSYYNYFEIKFLLLNLVNLNHNKKESSSKYINNRYNYNIQDEVKINKENFIKKGELILNYLSKIPDLENNNNNNNTINYELFNKSISFNTMPKNTFYFSNEIKNNTDNLYDKSTGYKNSNENYKTYSDKIMTDSNIDEFKNILNKTKIPEFHLNSDNNSEKSYKMNQTFNLGEKKNYNISDFTKYLNKMGLLTNNENDLRKVNSSQDLLNKSSCSIKSTKYVQNRNNTFYNLKYKNNILDIKTNLYNSTKRENKENKIDNEPTKKIPVINNNLFTNKNIQTKTYVHKRFSNNNNLNINNKLRDKNKNNNNNIKFQKKIIIIKSNKKNNMNNINIIEDNKENQKNNDNKDINTYNDNQLKSNNINILNQKIIIQKQENDDDILKNENDKKEKEEKMIYSSPIREELLKNAIISDTKKKVVNDYDNDNEESNINTTDKKNLLKIIYSPSNNIKQSTNKKNDISLAKNIDYNTYKNNNSINININPPNIIKTHNNIPYFVDPEKEICIGLELGNSECKIGIVNQNTSEIQLVCFDEDKYSIPTLISFGQNKKEIKIGYKADEDIFNNPSQTIFNIIKFFGQKYNDVKGKNDLWPFKVYSTNDGENRPYIKINFGPQKDKIFYFENILSIFLQKVFEFVFNKIKLENNSNYNTEEKKDKNDEDLNTNININKLNIILVLTIPNYFTYYQRQLIEKIIKTEIFPQINNNNENIKTYGQYKINLLEIKIENASSIASVCLNSNYDNNKNNNKNILILNLDGGSANVSITSSKIENDKQIYEVKSINGITKGGTDLIDDFIFEILKKFEDNIKKEILESPLALAKMRKLCQKMRLNIIQKEKDFFNIVEILENYDDIIEINRQDYENASSNLYNNIQTLIYDTLKNSQLKEKDINDIIFIGELCREKKLELIIEQLFKQDNRLYEELIYSNYMDNEKDFYIVGGAAYHAFNCINNNKYYFNDISVFNIGIQTYSGDLSYIIMKGQNIPIKNTKNIKLDNENELKIYEKYDNDNKDIKLIGTIEMNNDKENKMKYGYREIKIEYEINDNHQIFISLFNGEKYENKIPIQLLFDN